MASKQNNKYELEPVERIMLLNILPSEGNLVTIRIISEFRIKISFTDKEIQEWGIKYNEKQVTWNKTAKTVEFEIGKSVIDVLKDRIKELDNTGKITENVLPIIDKLGLK